MPVSNIQSPYRGRAPCDSCREADGPQAAACAAIDRSGAHGWASAICGGSRTGCVLLPHEAAPPRAVYRGAVTGASTGCARRRPHNARHADTARRDIPAADAAREHRSDDRQGLCRFGGEFGFDLCDALIDLCEAFVCHKYSLYMLYLWVNNKLLERDAMALWLHWWNAIVLLRPAFSRLRSFLWGDSSVSSLTTSSASSAARSSQLRVLTTRRHCSSLTAR